jgi:hypothetical protein
MAGLISTSFSAANATAIGIVVNLSPRTAKVFRNKVYDVQIHKPHEDHEAPAHPTSMLGLHRETHDQRWVACTRPVVMAGGEMTLEMLDLQWNAEARFYDAPLHVKALNGMMLVDDFGRQKFGDAGYAREELVAELGSAFLSADLDLTPQPREDHASYIANWLKVLKDDKRAIFSAAAHAQRAADYLHGLQPGAQQEAAE